MPDKAERKLIKREFYTIEDALKVACDASPKDTSSRDREYGWAGGSFDEAAELAENGYAAGTVILKRKLGMFTKVRQNMRPSPRWGESGSSVDIGRYLAGEPDCMVETVRTRRAAPVLRIGIERAVSATTPKEDIEATGASILAVTEALRTAGIPSEIWVSFTVRSWHSGDLYTLQVKIQDAGRPIDLDMLSYWTMHPTALRRIAFSIMEHENSKVRSDFGFKSGGGYGSPNRLDYAPEGREDAAKFDEYAPATASDATAWVRDVIQRRTGVVITHDQEGDR